MLAAVEPLGRELPVDLFLSIKEDSVTRGMTNYCFKCENIAEVAQTFKNNRLVTRLLKQSSQVELYCHSATCVEIQWNEMSCLTGPRCYMKTDI